MSGREAALACLAAGALGLAAWTVLAFAAPAPAFQGWWEAFLTVSAPSLGGLALLLIHRLTGGRWGQAFAPELEPAARLTPLVCAFALPIAFTLPLVFPWAAEPHQIDGSVRRFYLDTPLFLLRQGVILGGWSIVALRLEKISRSRWSAGLALAFHGVAVSVCAFDWILSLHPLFTNSAQGMMLASMQLAGGLAWAALQGVERPARSPAGDLGGLLFATLLGTAYLGYMSYLVGWYGDRPEPDGWWLPRSAGHAPYAQAALALGLLVPAALLALRSRMGARLALRGAGAGGLAGLACLVGWLVLPSLAPGALLPAVAALVAQGGAWVGGVLLLSPRLREAHA